MNDKPRKPFEKRPPRGAGAERPAKGGAASGKLFRKKDDGKPAYRKERAEKDAGERKLERPPREGNRDFDKPKSGPLKYWGKRQGKAERAAAKGEGATGSPGGERPARSFGERKQFSKPEGSGERKFDKRPRSVGDREQGGDRPRFRKDGPPGERPARPFGERKQFGKPEGSGERKFDKRPRSFGDREQGGDRPSFRKDGPSGDRPRTFGSGDKRPRPAAFGHRDRSERPDGRYAVADQSERIAKRLARAGISSRRDAEDLIEAGRVSVNGKVLTSPAFNVTAADKIELDGNEIPAIERTRLFLFNKPVGLVTTNRDPEGRKTVFDALPAGLPRLMTVGRLDINTEGLLLLTNDGGLSRVLELPATGWLRRYRVRVHGAVNEQALADLREGIAVDGVFYGAVEASLDREQGSNAWLTLGLREGKNREVKNILGALGLDVTRLIRISYGPFQLGELGEGEVLEIKGRTLRDQLGERLIEESGANFDADIAKPFSNKPVRRGREGQDRDDRRPSQGDDERPRRVARPTIVEGEGGLIKNFRRDRDRKREDTLDRWSTSPGGGRRFNGEGRPDRPGKPAFGKSGSDKPSFGNRPFGKPSFAKDGGRGGKGDREEPAATPGGRTANVWRAPGARPQAKKPSERAAERREGGKPAASAKPFRKSGPRKEDGGRGSGPRRFDGPKPGGRPGGSRPPRNPRKD